MKLIWQGTDVLMCTRYPKQSKWRKYPYMFALRLFAKLADIFVQAHVVVSKHLIEELKPLQLKKPFEIRASEPGCLDITKREHDGINVLYYRGIGANQPLLDWIYGYDIYLDIKETFPQVNFIEVNGSADMDFLYPIIDFMVRPNRHDGEPRMVMECQDADIPYYWSWSEPNFYIICVWIRRLI